MFLQKYKDFFLLNIVTEDVFVRQLSTNAGISV